MCPFPVTLVTYNRRVMARNGHIMTRKRPTIGVWWGEIVIFCQESDLRYACGRNVCTFPAVLLTYNRCMLERNGHNMRRN